MTIKKLTMDEKIQFWREIMEYAAERCIRVSLFTWNIFVYGTEDSGYGLTVDQNNPVMRDFVSCGTKARMDTYPLLAGIGVEENHPLLVDKMWYMFRIWGQLSYNLLLGEEYFRGELRQRFGNFRGSCMEAV